MIRSLAMILVTVAGQSALSQPWQLRSGEFPLTYAEVQDLTAGRTLIFPDGGQSRFSAGGAYSYTYPDEDVTTFGRFEVKRDGTVCIDVGGDRSRCDLYVRKDELLMQVNPRGERLPFRIELGLKP